MSNLTTSDNVGTILGAILTIKQDVGSKVTKNAKNGFTGMAYANLDAYLELLEPAFVEYGIVAITTSDTETVGEPHLLDEVSKDKKGHETVTQKLVTMAQVHVDTSLYHVESGEHLKRRITFMVENPSAQVVAGCETYGRRYNFKGFFNLTEGDDDNAGHRASGRQRRQGGAVRPPSTKALSFARELAAERGVEVPDEVVSDGRICSSFIDDMKQIPATKPQQSAPDEAFEKAKAHIESTDDPEKLREALSVVKNHKVLTVDAKEDLEEMINDRLEGTA